MLLRRILTPFIILLFATAALAQSKDSVLTDGATGPVTSQPRWRPPQYPTASHGMLEALSGRWSITASLWLAGPDKPPVTGAGYGRWRTMFDSRYLEIDDSVSITAARTNFGLRKLGSGCAAIATATFHPDRRDAACHQRRR